jgi:CO/xanthine dehydrogenase Mo-binding subunit
MATILFISIITFAKGKTEQSNFHDNPVLRINEVHILAEGGNNIKGVGEPGLPTVAKGRWKYKIDYASVCLNNAVSY